MRLGFQRIGCGSGFHFDGAGCVLPRTGREARLAERQQCPMGTATTHYTRFLPMHHFPRI
jgi:hypothetical protein